MRNKDNTVRLKTINIVLVVTLICSVFLFTLYFLPNTLWFKFPLVGVVSSAFGSGCVGLLWEYRSKTSFAEEMQADFFDRLEVLVDEFTVKQLVETDGLVMITKDFNQGVPWKEMIEKADSIDLCWWAGRTWFKNNLQILKTFSASKKLRLIFPDVFNDDVLDQMARDSGNNREVLKNATIEAINLLKNNLFENNIEVAFIPRVPRYMYMRMGEKICVSAYPLISKTFYNGITIICKKHLAIGSTYYDDFETLAVTTRFELLSEVNLHGQ